MNCLFSIGIIEAVLNVEKEVYLTSLCFMENKTYKICFRATVMMKVTSMQTKHLRWLQKEKRLMEVAMNPPTRLRSIGAGIR